MDGIGAGWPSRPSIIRHISSCSRKRWNRQGGRGASGPAEAALAEIVPTWSMAPVVAAYQAMRGVNFLAATTLVAEVGDLRRFDNPAQLMASSAWCRPSTRPATRPDAARSPRPATGEPDRCWSRGPGAIDSVPGWEGSCLSA